MLTKPAHRTRATPSRIARRAAGAVLLCAALLITGLVAVSWHYSLPEPGASAPAVRLYAGGQRIATIHPSHRAQSWVPLARIPRSVVDAVLIAEDRRFWGHPGVDPLAVGRALQVNLKSGEVREGASTVTQQLARTLFFDGRRTWARKFREALIALMLEVRYSKARILEAYLNTVYLGHDGDVPVYGLGAAARHFLGKDLASLDLEEAAWLAGAIRAPNRLLSGQRPEAGRRRDGIILALQEQRLIAPAAARRASSRPLPQYSTEANHPAPYFVDLVAAELGRRVVLPVSGEIEMHTTLNLALQKAAENAVRDGIARIERQRSQLAGRVQAAVVAIEPASGEIRALVGGRRYRDSPFNRATSAVRQPGSLFKPFVYLAAFEAERSGQGLTPASLLADEPLVVEGGRGSWQPKDMDGQFRGSVTVRRALEQSLNVPAIRVALSLGPRRVADVAHAMGIERQLTAVPSLALGTSEVTLLEISSAFAALANGGVRTAPTTLAPHLSAPGSVVAPLPPAARAVSAESAFMVTHLLRGVMRRGTGAGSSSWGLQEVSAGKTGTTDGLRDAWFVGYTPDLVVGVWVGLDDGGALGLTGAQAALPIWGPVMRAAIRQEPAAPFRPPAGVILAEVDRWTGRRVSFGCRSDDVVEEAFREGTALPEACDNVARTGVTALFGYGWVQKLLE